MYSIDYGYIYVCCSVQGYVFLLKIEGLLFSVFLAPRKTTHFDVRIMRAITFIIYLYELAAHKTFSSIFR